MENEKKCMDVAQSAVSKEGEMESFNDFFNAMARVVEKYGKIVLQELDYAA